MRTVRRLLYRDILVAVAFVTLAFMSLFFFISFVEELERLRRGAPAWHAALLAALELPTHLYDVFPIMVLIGSVFTLARLAQTSEFTILRTGGLGPGRALGLLSLLATGFAAFTFVVGDWLVPLADQQAERARASWSGGVVQRAGGAWLKDKLVDAEGQGRWFTVNVQGASLDGRVKGVRLFEFDAQGRLVQRWLAAEGRVTGDGEWQLQKVERTHWPTAGSIKSEVQADQLSALTWRSNLSLGVVNAALLKASNMSTLELFRYTRHLAQQEQAAQRYEIQFWRKALYPFACFVMAALALPFAYLHARNGGISARVFGGIMLGISFVLLDYLTGHLGTLQNWTPWVVALAPSLLYLGISMSAFAWLVRYR
ncbi:MAG: LPS export ABC transporter permease LptG [Burkholderiales bacterium]|nr:LPS export ABC transporter permease LptG [Burkholderiales bacterium]